MNEIDMENDISKENKRSHMDTSFNKYDLNGDEGQATEGGLSLEEDLIVKEKLKLEKEKIKRRRSSRGKYLSEGKPLYCPSQESEKGNVDSSDRVEINNVNKNILTNAGSRSEIGEQDLGKIEAKNIMEAEIKLYDEKTNQLKTEYASWKNIVKSRKRNLAAAAREYKEAKEGDTLIEEDDITPQHKKEFKTITLSQPDYNQYLKEVKFGYEKALLTEAEVKRVSTICQSFNDLSNTISRNSYKMLEEKTFGVKRDPRDVLRELQNSE